MQIGASARVRLVAVYTAEHAVIGARAAGPPGVQAQLRLPARATGSSSPFHAYDTQQPRFSGCGSGGSAPSVAQAGRFVS